MILQDTYLKADNVPKGIELIMDRLCHTRLLLILDDVDESNQIENLLGRCDWFSSGSRIIITTRDKQVVTSLGKDHLIYEVEKLNQYEAYELFSLHTFQMNKPREDYSEVAKKIIHYANGLPLALKIIGSDLCGKRIQEWENALEKYKNIPHKKIQEKLKISYDGLEKTEKDIFLHVACFFKGFEKDYVTNILETCNLYPRDGICKLIDKCLITVDERGILSMHDLLQQIGREIVQQESEQLENCSRIWCYENAHEVITRNMGSDKIQAMMLHSLEPVTMKLQSESFERMKNLKFLSVKNVHICEEFQHLPNGLRLLQWPKFPFSSWPSKYCPEKLVALDMSWSSRIRMEAIFKQGIQLKNLKHINLSYCLSITELPELCAPNLETLDLSHCFLLVTVHESVGFLDRLRKWDLQYCLGLKNLPNNLRLKSLEEFNLTNCHELEKFPNIHQETKRLKKLDLSGSGNYNLWCIKKLLMLEVTTKLRPLCNSFVGLSEYEFLSFWKPNFSGRGIESEIVMKPNYFPVLKDLNLSGADIVSIPESLNRFTTLESLNVKNCKMLRQILGLPQFIKRVDASRCPSLDVQSSSRLWNQIEEILFEGERSNIFVDPRSLLVTNLFLDDNTDNRSFIVPAGTEIPRWLNSKHQSAGNSISFLVGRKFPNVFAVHFQMYPTSKKWDAVVSIMVFVSINGFVNVWINDICLCEISDTLWIFSRSHLKLQKLLNESNPSAYNVVEVIYISCNRSFELRRWGVNVECICCPQKSSISSSMALTHVDNDSDSNLNLPLKKRRKY